MSTYVQVVLPLVLPNLLQNGKVLLLNAIVLRLLAVHRLLLFHVVVVEVLDVLLGFRSNTGYRPATSTAQWNHVQLSGDLDQPNVCTDHCLWTPPQINVYIHYYTSYLNEV